MYQDIILCYTNNVRETKSVIFKPVEQLYVDKREYLGVYFPNEERWNLLQRCFEVSNSDFSTKIRNEKLIV